MIVRARQIVVAAVVAVGMASAALLVATSSAGLAVAAPACLAHVTSQGDDPICVGTSDGKPVVAGSPDFGVYGPGGAGGGVRSGALLPGQSWNAPIG